jgi:hypothetical protein
VSVEPAPPHGTRWVGYGQVVVAVPDWWTTGETSCLAPVEDTVYFDPSVQADCQESPATSAVREVSAFAMLDASQGYAQKETRAMKPAGVPIIGPEASWTSAPSSAA